MEKSVGEVDDAARPAEVLVGAKVTHGLDVEGLEQELRVGLAHARDGAHRGLGHFLRALAFPLFVELLFQAQHGWCSLRQLPATGYAARVTRVKSRARRGAYSRLSLPQVALP